MGIILIFYRSRTQHMFVISAAWAAPLHFIAILQPARLLAQTFEQFRLLLFILFKHFSKL